MTFFRVKFRPPGFEMLTEFGNFVQMVPFTQSDYFHSSEYADISDCRLIPQALSRHINNGKTGSDNRPEKGV